jgi:hypothetical protein
MEIVRQPLEVRSFSHREIARGAVVQNEHVFAAGDAVSPRLDSLRLLVQCAAGVPE